MNIGDKVVFKNENLRGEITQFYGPDLVGVTIEDDFELQVHRSEIVVTETAFPDAEKPKTAVVSKEVAIKTGKGIFLKFDSVGQNNYDISIINGYPDTYFVAVYSEKQTGVELLGSGNVGTVNLLSINRLSRFNPEKWGTIHVVTFSVRQFPSTVPETVKYSKAFNQGDFQTPAGFDKLENAWFIFQVEQWSAPIPEIMIPVVTETTTVSWKNSHQKPTDIVDLHLETLMPDFSGVAADEAIKIQMDAFHKNLEMALAWKMPSITFIHGIGTGVLKNLIKLSLKNNKHVLRYTDADESEFGFGATKITLKQ